MDLWYVPTMIVALNMLPRLAPFAEDRVPIVIFECTDAFDGIRFLFFRGSGVGNGAVDGRRIQRDGDRIRLRGWMRDDDRGGICHNLTGYLLSG